MSALGLAAKAAEFTAWPDTPTGSSTGRRCTICNGYIRAGETCRERDGKEAHLACVEALCPGSEEQHHYHGGEAFCSHCGDRYPVIGYRLMAHRSPTTHSSSSPSHSSGSSAGGDH